MKKKVLSQALMLLAVTFIFSSCLGDIEERREMSTDFVCVRGDGNGQKGALTQTFGFVLSQAFDEMQEGTILMMGYKIIGTQTGYYPTLTEVNIDKNRVYTPYEQMEYRWNAAEANIPREIYPKSLSSTQYWSPYDVFLDRWMFNVTLGVSEGNEFKAYFYYDKDNQEEGKNRFTLDVRFVEEGTGTGEALDVPQEFVANFDGIRDYIRNMSWFEASTSQEVTPVYVKFRYRKSDDSKPEGFTEETIGTFTDNSLQFIISN